MAKKKKSDGDSPENDTGNAVVEDIIPKSVEEEITQSYIDYAMSVIVARALSDVRDGLKPVHRRILYAMFDMKLTHNAKFKKSAAVVGEVLGKYHPHGDTSVYDAMVRLAQPFSMRYPLVDGQGNFGSIDGDGAAAMRYTEARLTKIAEEMLENIHEDTVDWRENYDQTRHEPIVLPTKFPFQLCNGTMGIAVGMATNMPPHNLTEVIDACLAMIDNDDITIDEIMEHIKGPDFPTGGTIYDSRHIKDVYEQGKGGITMRAKVHYETTDDKKEQDIIVIDELPYQVNKAKLVAKIGELVNEKKIEGIVDIIDESNKADIRVTIKLDKETSKEEVMTRLFKYTDLQSNFNVNNVVLTEKGIQPRHLNIKQLLKEFVTFRREVVLRRSKYQLGKAKDRLHILEGLERAIDMLDEVIETIKESETREGAKNNLMEKFEFTDPQSEYILMLRLQTLVGLEIKKILNEIEEKKETIDYLTSVIEDEKKLDQVVVEELTYIKEKYGDERKTDLSDDVEKIYKLDKNIKRLKKLDELIKEDCFTWIGHDYKIRVLYQTRVLKIPDNTYTLTQTHNQDKMIAISDTGELVIERLKELGKFTVNSKPMDIAKEYKLNGNLIFSETMGFDFDYLIMLTDQNNIKKVTKELLLKFQKFPTTIMRLEDGENIIKVLPVKEGDRLGVISQKGMMLIFDEEYVRAMGKTAGGVKAIDLKEGDQVADVFKYEDEPFIFIHSDQAGKLVSSEDIFDQKTRGDMKRAQAGVTCATVKRSQELRGAIAIYEGGVKLAMKTGRIDLVDSDNMDLKLPDDPLSKITNGKIVKMWRPYTEKEKRREKEELDTYKKKKSEIESKIKGEATDEDE